MLCAMCGRYALRISVPELARILGIDKQVGSLEGGKHADVIVLDGPVYQPRSKVERMWIRGREVELTSRQTELADKHR